MNQRHAQLVPTILLTGMLLTSARAAEDAPLKTLPYVPALDLSALDRSVDPCVDLYQFACGGWKMNNPIPADQGGWSVYGKMHQENMQYLWGILADAAKPSATRTAVQQQIGDFFGSCMDEASIDAAGIKPIQDDLARIEALSSKKDLAALVAALHPTVGGQLLFSFGSEQDAKNSEEVIAGLDAGGLALPDRDYYLLQDKKSAETRALYRQHIEKLLQLSGWSAARSKDGATQVMSIETALAKASLSATDRRDPYKIYHRMKLAELRKLAPSFDWTRYLAGRGLGAVESLDVSQPEFVKELQNQLATRPLAAWKSYLRWHRVNAAAEFLAKPFAEEDFAFYGAHLRGVKAQRPRWKRCVAWTDGYLGEALGQEFVARAFSAEIKNATVDMVQRIESAMKQRIEQLSWMSAATKEKALLKLAKMRNKIGYPAVWRDYSSVAIKPGEFAANVAAAGRFEDRRQLGKIGHPVDRDEWAMTPPTVDAYYQPSMNDMNFPAGVLLPPLFDLKIDLAPSWGNTGGTIGHELTHGFDDEGRQFDGNGNLSDWWSEADAKEFERRAQCIVDQYGKYTVVDDIKLNSRLTLGEDVADLGGLILAWVAWKGSVAGQPLAAVDGFTPEQRFFIGFAQWDCSNVRDEMLRLSAISNPHSPSWARINGVVVNMPEYAQAFQCKPGQPMTKEPKETCSIW